MPDSERIAYLNGSFVPEREAHLSIFDSALATGEKVVEVTRTFNHRPYKLDQHLERLYRGLEALKIDLGISPERLSEITQETLDRNLNTQPGNVDWQILQYISKGPAAIFEVIPEEELHPTVLVHCIPLVNRIGKMANKYIDGVDLVVVEQKAIPQDVISPQIKSNGRMDHVVGRLQAQQLKPGSTGVLLGTNGYITEGTGASLFFVDKSRIRTAQSSRVLLGITRGVIFDIAQKLHIPVEEDDLTIADAEKADEIFITSTVICQLHGRSFNNKILNYGIIGPITEKVRRAFNEEVGLDFVNQAQEYGQFLKANGRIR